MGEPEDERNAKWPHERRRENGIDRAHVCDDRAAPEVSQLSRESSLETDAAARLVAGPKRPNAAVRGQYAVDRAVGEHDDFVDELGKGSEFRDRRGKRRVSRIDLLCDEDDLGHRGS
jgi:hypothetical protein